MLESTIQLITTHGALYGKIRCGLRFNYGIVNTSYGHPMITHSQIMRLPHVARWSCCRQIIARILLSTPPSRWNSTTHFIVTDNCIPASICIGVALKPIMLASEYNSALSFASHTNCTFQPFLKPEFCHGVEPLKSIIVRVNQYRSLIYLLNYKSLQSA